MSIQTGRRGGGSGSGTGGSGTGWISHTDGWLYHPQNTGTPTSPQRGDWRERKETHPTISTLTVLVSQRYNTSWEAIVTDGGSVIADGFVINSNDTGFAYQHGDTSRRRLIGVSPDTGGSTIGNTYSDSAVVTKRAMYSLRTDTAVTTVNEQPTADATHTLQLDNTKGYYIYSFTVVETETKVEEGVSIFINSGSDVTGARLYVGNHLPDGAEAIHNVSETEFLAGGGQAAVIGENVINWKDEFPVQKGVSHTGFIASNVPLILDGTVISTVFVPKYSIRKHLVRLEPFLAVPRWEAKTYAYGDWIIENLDNFGDMARVYKCIQAGAQTGTFASNASRWQVLGNASSMLDTDRDTGIEVERTTDSDTVVIKTSGVDRITVSAAGDTTVKGTLTVDDPSAPNNKILKSNNGKIEASLISESGNDILIDAEVTAKKVKTKNRSIQIGPNMAVSNSGDDMTFTRITEGQEASLVYSRFNNVVGAQAEGYLEFRRLWERVDAVIQSDSSEVSGDHVGYGANTVAGSYNSVITTSHLSYNPLATEYFIRGASDSIGCRLKVRKGSSPTSPIIYQSSDDFDFNDNIGFRNRIYQQALTGTISVTSGSASVVGVGTSFDTELQKGDLIQLPGQGDVEYIVESVTGATNLVLESSLARPLPTITASAQTFRRGGVRVPLPGGFYFEANTTYFVTFENKAGNLSVRGKRDALGQTGQFVFFFERIWQDIEILEVPNNGHFHMEMSPQIVGGTGAITIGTNTVTGTGTAFLSQFQVGDAFDLNGQSFTVQSIQSNTALTTNENAVRTVNSQSQSDGIYRHGDLLDLMDYAGQKFLTVNQQRNVTIPRNLTIQGSLSVEGATSTVKSETLNVAANHVLVNDGYSAGSAQTGGLVVVSAPTATQTTVSNGVFTPGVAATSNPRVVTVGSGTFAASDIVLISAATKNAGLFEVLSHVGTTLTMRGVGTTATVEAFTQNQFEAHTGNATITKVLVSVARAGVDGNWEQAKSSTTPLVFKKFASNDTALTAGSILFAGSSGGISQDNASLHWKDGTNRLGIKTNEPRATAHIVGGALIGGRNTDTETTFSVDTAIANIVAPSNIGPSSGTTETALRLFRDGTSGTKYNQTADFQIGSYATSGIDAQSELKIRLGNGSTNSPDTDALRLLGSGKAILPSIIGNKRLALWDTADNDHQFYGFGINNQVLRYQTASASADHVFYAATGVGASQELGRFKGDKTFEAQGVAKLKGGALVAGIVGVDTSDGADNQRLRVTAGSVDTFNNSRGASIDLHGNEHFNAGRLDIVGGGTGDVTTWTGGQERITTLGSNGNTGYGNTNPLALVTIGSGMGVAPSNSQLLIEDTTAPGITLSGNFGQLRFGRNNNNGAGFLAYNHSNNEMSFGVNGATPFRISAAQVAQFSNALNIGLVTDGSRSIHAATEGTTEQTAIQSHVASSHYGNTAFGPAFVLSKSRGSFATQTPVNAGDALGIVSARGHDGVGHREAGSLLVQATETWGGTARGSSLKLRSTKNGSTSVEDVIEIDGNNKIHLRGPVEIAGGANNFLTIGSHDNVDEGGEISWAGAGSWSNWTQDVYQNKIRFFTDSASTSRLEVFNLGAGRADLVVGGRVEVEETITVKGGSPAAGRKLIATDSVGNAVWGTSDSNTAQFAAIQTVQSASATTIGTLSLPRAGKYKITSQVRLGGGAKDSWATAWLRNDGTDIVGSYAIQWFESALTQGTIYCQAIVVTTAAATITAMAQASSGTCSCWNNTGGTSKIFYEEM